MAVTPDGRHAVSSSLDRTLRLWGLESGKEIATFTGESEVVGCALTPDGRTIVAGESSGRVHFLRLVEADKTKPPIGETKIQLLRAYRSTTWGFLIVTRAGWGRRATILPNSSRFFFTNIL